QVLALAQAAGGAVSERADEALIARNDLPEGLAVARKTFGYEIGIVWCRCGNHARRHHIVAYVAAKPEKVTGKIVARSSRPCVSFSFIPGQTLLLTVRNQGGPHGR